MYKERTGTQLNADYRLEVRNRIRNLFWTVSGDYSLDFDPDVSDYRNTKKSILYEAMKQGAFARYFDQQELGIYLMKKVYLTADEDQLTRLVQLCIEEATYPHLQKERQGTGEIREQAFREQMVRVRKKRKTDVLDQVQLLLMEEVLQESAAEEPAPTEDAGKIFQELQTLQQAETTGQILQVIDHIYNTILDPQFESRRTDSRQVMKMEPMGFINDVWQECMTDEEMEKIIARYLATMKKKMIGLTVNHRRREYMAGDRKEQLLEGQKEDPGAVKRVREYVELNYGKSFVSELDRERMNRKFCTGIHRNCQLYLTDGILHSPVLKNNQYRFSQLQYEKNRLFYGRHYRIIKKNINDLADSLKKIMVLKNDDNISRATSGMLVPNRLWKVGRTDEEKLFDRKKKSESSEFVVDILLDSSGSQAKRQSQVAAQCYIISEALSAAGIPHRVSSYSSFWGYTIIRRFRDYDDPKERNGRIFEFRASGSNRDGLVMKTISASLQERPEEHKILIVLSDGRPCDMSVPHKGTIQPMIYDGEDATKDTAAEIRRARNQGLSVIGIFAGSETDLVTERRIFGKDFAYIRNISNFSRIVGTFITRQIDEA